MGLMMACNQASFSNLIRIRGFIGFCAVSYLMQTMSKQHVPHSVTAAAWLGAAQIQYIGLVVSFRMATFGGSDDK